MAAHVTAIVLNWCNEEETAACLESLAASTYTPLDVLLVDNASPDGSGERLRARFPEVDYLETTTNIGYAGGNNRGMERALADGAEYLLILNDDTVVDRECIERLVQAMEESSAAVTAPQIVYFDDPDRVWYGGGTFSRLRGLGKHTRLDKPRDPTQSRATVSFVTGCCFLFRGTVFNDVGGFDESYFAYVEDAELSVRLAKHGQTMVYEPTAVVRHRIVPNAPPTPFQIRQRERNRRRLVRSHFGQFDRVRFALWFYPTRAVHAARYVLQRDWQRARAVLEGALNPLSP